MIKVRSRYNKKNFDKLASAANDILGVSGTAVVDVDFVSEENIHELNLRTRGVDRATDVLSYPFLDDASMPMDEEHYPEDYDYRLHAVPLGCMAICREYIKKAAEEDKTVYISDVYRAFTHSLLHLFGYDHVTEEQYDVMHAKENQIMTKAGLLK